MNVFNTIKIFNEIFNYPAFPCFLTFCLNYKFSNIDFLRQYLLSIFSKGPKIIFVQSRKFLEDSNDLKIKD